MGSSLTVILKAMRSVVVPSPELERSVEGMGEYVRRSAASSPGPMRERGDVCRFMLALAQFADEFKGMQMAHLFSEPHLDAPKLCGDATDAQRGQLRRLMARLGVQNAAMP